MPVCHQERSLVETAFLPASLAGPDIHVTQKSVVEAIEVLTVEDARGEVVAGCVYRVAKDD
jgi:hypothetical protein